MLNHTRKKHTSQMNLCNPGSSYKSACGEPFFEIYEFIINDQNRLRCHTPAGRKLHTIIWIKEGCGKFFIDMQQYDFNDNTIFNLEPGQLYQLETETSARGYHISFPASFLDMSEMFIGLRGSPACGQQWFFKTVVCGVSMDNELKCLVREMIIECANQFLLGPEVLRGLVGIFMVHLARNNNTNKARPGTNHDDQLAKKFMHLLGKNVFNRKMVSDYANELAISANYLNQVMKRHTGFTASQHIQQYTILEAKRRALYFGTTMKDTAYYLGFDDLAHFSKFFKKNAGTSFREFKNQMTGC